MNTFLERQGKTEAEYQKYLEGVDVPTITPDGKITFAQDSVETFINEDGEKQKLFTKVGDDYWKPGKYALQATLFNNTHNQFVERYLTSGMTRDYRESAITYAGEKTIAFKDAIGKGARWVYNNKAEAAKKTSDWMGKTINTGFQNVTSVGGWGNIAQGVKDYGAGMLDRVENATTNAYITIASRLPFKSSAKETMNQLNTIYGRDMWVPMAELTSIQGAISGMEVWPIGKGATLGYKAAVPAMEKAIKSTAPVVKKAVSNDAAAIASKQSNWKQVEELVNSSVGKTSSGAADKSLKAGGQNGTVVTAQKIYTDSNGNPIGELVGNGRREKTLSDTSKIINLDQDIFSNRTLDAYNEASLVKAIMDKKDTLKNGKVIPRYRDNKNQVITVITHEDGTVSVGISGTKINNMQKLQSDLDEAYGKGKYTVGIGTLDETSGIERGYKGDIVGNKPGVCAEPHCAVAARQNKSPMTGSATIWRGKGENRYPYTGKNVHLFGNDQMNPCPTCGHPHNLRIYNNEANKGKKP